jgi:hypothetical protein
MTLEKLLEVSPGPPVYRSTVALLSRRHQSIPIGERPQ